MTRDETLKVLHHHLHQLREQFGVRSLLVFGSLARDEAVHTSDVDLLVEFDRPTGYFGLVRLQLFMEELLGCTVDIGTPNSLRPALRQRIARESIRVA